MLSVLKLIVTTQIKAFTNIIQDSLNTLSKWQFFACRKHSLIQEYLYFQSPEPILAR